jgi:hypothetical protein
MPLVQLVCGIVAHVAVAYLVLDFILGMLLGRCVLPGLKCSACRRPIDRSK